MKYYSDNNRSKPAACRSTFMRAEEIAQERARSGWNQYDGEEEEGGMMPGQRWNEQPQMMPGQSGRQWNEQPMMQPGQRWNEQPQMMPGQSGQRWNEQLQMQPGQRWNEQLQTMPGQPGQQWNEQPMMPGQQWNEQQPMMRPGQQWNNRQPMPQQGSQEARPIFWGPDYDQVMEEQRNVERDLRMLQSMYPEAAKMLLPYIEETCDRMEYEGSMMFDRFPDQTTLYRMQDEIYRQVQDQFPGEDVPEEPEEVFSMQYQGRRRNPPGKNWLQDLIRVLLLQEMHHRRGRHRNRRRGY